MQGEPAYNNFVRNHLFQIVTAGHRGCSTDERPILKNFWAPPHSCFMSSRQSTQRANVGNTLKFKSFIWDTDLSGVQWEIPAEVWPTLGV